MIGKYELMLFSFLKYLQPTHYFTLPNRKDKFIYPKFSEIPEGVSNSLDIDKKYTSITARQYDLSYQAIEKGYIGMQKELMQLKSYPLLMNIGL